MTAIAMRELRLLLLSPSGALLLSVWTFLMGALFLLELSAFEQAEQRALQLGDPALLALLDFNDLLLASVQNHLVVVLLFLGPLIGARLFADGPTRDWLLHAAPSLAQLVAGKLVAGALVVLALVSCTFGLTLFLALAGQGAQGEAVAVDVGQSLLAFITLFLAGTSFVAVAAVVAARSSAPLAAALGSFLLLLVLWLLPGSAALLGPTLGEVAVFLSPASHVENGLRGVLSSGDVLWFVSLIAGAGVACGVSLDGSRR
ncbi:MAG: ABC transporter permease subunit [Deltaproteobacteria bacterium]|nr:ABC transporter permease subunit [Deltaproteobacteria bacterium]